jgi:acetyltransferase-like isoleucine patch superfamily enzyme
MHLPASGGIRALGLAALLSWSGSGSLAQPHTTGPELRVNHQTAGEQLYPAVAASGDGSFIAIWSSEESDPRQSGFVGRRFDSSAASFAAQFDVLRGGWDPALAANAAGGFVVVWRNFYSLSGQLYDSTGAPQGDVFGISFDFGSSKSDPQDVAMAPAGDFVVAWTYYGGTGLVVQRGNAAGEPVSEAMDIARDAGSPAVAMNAALDFVVVWATRSGSGSDQIHGRRFTGGGNQAGATFEVSTNRVSSKGATDVAMAPDGSFVVVWDAGGQDGDGSGVFAQRYDRAGRRLGGELRVNSHTLNDQSDPSLAMKPDGSFFVAWASHGQDGSDDGVFGQWFDAAGRKAGGELAINGQTAGTQSEPAVAISSNGALFVVWEGASQTDETRDIFGRLILAGDDGGDDGGSGDGDFDGDGIPDAVDNCPTVTNQEQADAQGDGLGDACVSPDVILPPDLRLGANPVIGQGTVVESGVAIGDGAAIGEFVLLKRQARAGDDLSAGDFVVVGARSRLGDQVSIGRATRLGAGVTIGNQVTIGDHAILNVNVVVRDGATIGPLVVLFAGVQIGEGATVEMGARVGRRAIVRPGAVVPAGTRVPPGAIVE